MTAEPSAPDRQSDEDVDPYVSICKALQPGVLLTVNDSDPTQSGTGELEVEYVDSDTGNVTLSGYGETQFEISHDDPEYDTVIREVPTEMHGFSRRHDPVTTIEIIGIA